MGCGPMPFSAKESESAYFTVPSSCLKRRFPYIEKPWLQILYRGFVPGPHFSFATIKRDCYEEHWTQGWRQEFSDGGLTLPTSGLKHGFQGTINTKTLRKIRFSPSEEGLACSEERGL